MKRAVCALALGLIAGASALPSIPLWDRTYFFAGDFSKGVGTAGAKTNLNSIAYWRGDAFSPVGEGAPNGPVYDIEYVLSCNRLYAVGAFNKIGDVETGNVAYFDFDANTWNAVGSANWNEDDKVNSIDVSCANVDICGCDVYVGGLFNMNSTDFQNVAKFVNDKDWDNLAGGVSGEVHSVVHNSGRLYVGGAMSEVKFFENDKWTDLVTGIDGTVYSMTINKNKFSKDLMAIGGQFTKPCKGVCVLEPTGDKTPKQKADGLGGQIYAVGIEDTEVYAAGNITQNSIRNVAHIRDSANAWDTVVQDDFNFFDEPIRAMWVCQSDDVGCRRGSVMIGGDGFNSLGFFDARNEDDGWQIVGGGLNGPVYAIDSTVKSINSASIVSCSLFLLLALLFAL